MLITFILLSILIRLLFISLLHNHKLRLFKEGMDLIPAGFLFFNKTPTELLPESIEDMLRMKELKPSRLFWPQKIHATNKPIACRNCRIKTFRGAATPGLEMP